MQLLTELTALSLLVAGTVSGATQSQQLAGQRVICSYPGTTVPSATLDAIQQGLCSGIIFFGDNLNQSDGSVLRNAVAQLNAANKKGPNPNLALLLNTDQEGGEVRRLPGAPVQSAKTVGESSDPASLGSSTGTAAGKNLAVSYNTVRYRSITFDLRLSAELRPQPEPCPHPGRLSSRGRFPGPVRALVL